MPEVVEKYRQSFEAFERSLNDDSSSSVHNLRKRGLNAFEKHGFPIQKVENWKYTKTTPFLATSPLTSINEIPEDISYENYNQIQANKLVFVDGFFRKDLSHVIDKEESLVISSLKEALNKNHEEIISKLSLSEDRSNSPEALNTAFLNDGAYVRIPNNKTLAHPVFFLFLFTQAAERHLIQPRNLISLGENSECSIIESYQSLSENDTYSNCVTDIDLEKNSRLQYYKIQPDQAGVNHLGSTIASQQGGSNLHAVTITLNGSLIRNNFAVALNGERTYTSLSGLYLLDDNDHVDNHIEIDHRQPNCESHQLYKGLMDGSSTGVFNGKIFVQEDAQKTNAFQSNKNILLSDSATINSKPQLEIFADDVKCSHGSTTGQMDEQALFYLRSRGLGKNDAKAILNLAFAADVIDRVKIPELKELLHQQVQDKLKVEFAL